MRAITEVPTITISSIRLSVGWSWETLTLKFFEFVTEEVELSREMNIFINFIAVIVIIIIALIMHWSTLSWKVVKEEENNSSSPDGPVNNQSMMRETDNPLRIHVS